LTNFWSADSSLPDLKWWINSRTDSPKRGLVLCLLRQVHASLHASPESGFVTADVYASGKPEVVRPALEIVRGYLAQKLIARAVNSRFVERGLVENARKGG
jgi:S-adenosylmethionine/arginine decarboxylase-like enzyme